MSTASACLPLSVIDRGFEPRSGQTKDYKIGLCGFTAMHTTLSLFRSESE